jgi:hypothetical protein
MINEELLDSEVASIQSAMGNTSATSDEYAAMLKRLKEIEELRRYYNHEDPETMKIVAQENEGKKTRKHGLIMKCLGGAGIVGLMCLSHFLQGSQIMERADEKLIDKWSRNDE